MKSKNDTHHLNKVVKNNNQKSESCLDVFVSQTIIAKCYFSRSKYLNGKWQAGKIW